MAASWQFTKTLDRFQTEGGDRVAGQRRSRDPTPVRVREPHIAGIGKDKDGGFDSAIGDGVANHYDLPGRTRLRVHPVR